MISMEKDYDEGAAAPSSTPAGQVYPEPEFERWTACELCGRQLSSKRGMSQHQRFAHAEQYHRDNVPKVLRRGCDQEECVLVAREELRLVEGDQGQRYNIKSKRECGPMSGLPA